MIKTRDQIKSAEAPYVIDKEVFLGLARGELAKVADKFAKSVIILNEDEMVQLRRYLEISEIRRKVGKLGGRPKLPDLTDEQIAALPKEERQRYKMRIWKRNSRQRSKNA